MRRFLIIQFLIINSIPEVSEMSLVSVVIPCYNQGRYIDECIKSVLSQTYPSVEIIIVNDGSNDSFTKARLNEIKEKYKKVQIIDIINSGVSVARNVGIEKAHGKYILPLDGDDKISEDYIFRCMEVFNKRNVDIVYCIGQYFGDKKGLWPLIEYSSKEIIKANMVFCSAMFKKEDWQDCNGYNENMVDGLEDWDFWLSMTERNKTFYRVNEVHFYYRIKSKSRNTNMLDYEKRKRTILKLQENHPELYKNYRIDLAAKITLSKRVSNRIVYECRKIKLQIIVYYNKISKFRGAK